MIKKISLINLLLICVLFWTVVFYAVGFSLYTGAAAGLAFYGLAYKFRYHLPQFVLLAGVYVEVWTGELIKQFGIADQLGWMNGIKDYSQYADKNVIHMIDVGVNPDVLLNNTTYPIDVQDLDDGDKTFSLDKWQTKATRVTDDELHGISYDKISLKREQHGIAIIENKMNKAIHALAPAGNTTDTTVLVTTGADDGTGRLMLTRADVVRLKKACDKAKIPLAGRRLVLCPDHVADLLSDTDNNQRFIDQYYNYTTGKIANFYSFEVYEFINNPYYVISAKTKLAYGGTPIDGTHSQASVMFLPAECMMATGTTKMYYSDATINPLTQENLINFRHYFIVLPKKNRAIGAIISGKAA